MKPTQQVEINGQMWPAHFGTFALAAFCQDLGIAMGQLETKLNDLSLMESLQLAWHGLKDGARREKKEFNYSVADIADILDEDPDGFTRLLDVVRGQQPVEQKKQKVVVAGKAKK